MCIDTFTYVDVCACGRGAGAVANAADVACGAPGGGKIGKLGLTPVRGTGWPSRDTLAQQWVWVGGSVGRSVSRWAGGSIRTHYVVLGLTF